MVFSLDCCYHSVDSLRAPKKKHAHVFGGGKKSSSNIMKLVEKRKKILLASVSVCCGVKMESRSVECVHRKTHPSRRINDRIDVFR